MIEFGSKPFEDKPTECCEKDKGTVYYPSFYVNNKGEGLDAKVGEWFHAKAKLRVKSKTVTEHDGEKKYSCEVEVFGVMPIDDGEDFGEALESAME